MLLLTDVECGEHDWCHAELINDHLFSHCLQRLALKLPVQIFVPAYKIIEISIFSFLFILLDYYSTTEQNRILNEYTYI